MTKENYIKILCIIGCLAIFTKIFFTGLEYPHMMRAGYVALLILFGVSMTLTFFPPKMNLILPEELPE